MKDEKGDLATDVCTIVAGWRKYFSHLLILHRVNDVGQRDIHTSEPKVPELSAFRVEIAVGNLKRHKS